MKRLLFSLLLLLPAAPEPALAQLSATLPVAKGVYRLPYADGTQVEITRDHTNHGNNDPTQGALGTRNRMDMVGRNGTNYQIVAAGDGWIRLIEDTNTLWCPSSSNPNICTGVPNCCERSDTSCNANCANNYVWIEHPNGEWTKYSHPRTNSVTSRGWAPGDWVNSGEVLGIEDQVGFASGPHLHFEVAEPRQRRGSYDPEDLADPDHPIDADGFLKGDGDITDPSYSLENRVVFFCQLGLLLDNDVVEAVACDDACGGAANQTLTGTRPDNTVGYLQVSSTLTVDGYTVNNGGGLAVRGASSVRILPGFEAESGSYFSASVAGCDTPGG